MTPIPIFDAPQLEPPKPRTEWDAEYEAFLRLLPELLRTHRDQDVAIHEGKVVGVGLTSWPSLVKRIKSSV